MSKKELKQNKLNIIELLIFGIINIISELIKRLPIVLLIIFVIIHREPETIRAFGEIFINILNSNTIKIILIFVILFLIIFIIFILWYFNYVFKNTIKADKNKK